MLDLKSITKLDALRISDLISQPRKVALDAFALKARKERKIGPKASSTDLSPWIPDSTADMRFLPQSWRFPPDVRYRKSTPGAMSGYSQRKFEIMVTAGYILATENGLKWAANGKYLLFKDDSHTAPPAHDLFAQPITPTNRGALKLPTSTNFTPTPLNIPWRFSALSLWQETYPSAISQWDHDWKLEDAVNAGVLVVDAKGIRHPHTHVDDYILKHVGERDVKECLHAPIITRMEKPETPIVEIAEDEAMGTSSRTTTPNSIKRRGVKFNRSCLSLNYIGEAKEGEVIDNEGKTESLYVDRDRKTSKAPQRKVVFRGRRHFVI